jgi:hypothetical protein
MCQRRHQRVATTQADQRGQAFQADVLDVTTSAALPVQTLGMAFGHHGGFGRIKLVQRDRLPPGERVVRAKHQLPRLEENLACIDATERGCLRRQHRIEFAFPQTAQQSARLAFGNAQTRTGKVLRKRPDQMRQKVRPQRGRYAEAQFAAKSHLAGPRQLLQVFSRGEYRINLFQQTLAARRGHDPSPTPFEQRRSQRLLHFLHLVRQARGTDVHGACRAVETAMAMHRLHQRKIAQRDGRQGGRNHRTLHMMKGVCVG